MNNIIQLKGTFQQRPSENRPSYPKLPVNSRPITSEHLKRLVENLKQLREFWVKEKVIEGALISVHYTKVVAKSNRISGLFSKGSKTANSSIVGARFSDEGQEKKHIITYYIYDEIILDTINNLEKCILVIENQYRGSISESEIINLANKEVKLDRYGIPKSTFCKIVVDSHYIERFDLPDNRAEIKRQSIITIYKTEADTALVMKRIGIDVPSDRMVNDTTVLLRLPQITLLKEKAPYLIAMATEDISKLSFEDASIADEKIEESGMTIDPPKDEPTIGVIDTMFDERVYFSEWVEFRKMIDDEIPLDQRDYDHGTAITSIIVDGPAINPDFDDGCGRFKVRHFGVAVKGQYSSFSIMKLIQEIVEANSDIRVWNLSLGSENEINLNSISLEASILDKIQYEKDVIFVIAGTNNNKAESKRIGAPADSINSIVVNSVNSKGEHASYSRVGPVLSFFNKPDVSSYGGDKKSGDFIRVCTPNGQSLRTGTSFAAPWVTRKMAYLIEVLGLSREVAKALIVDSSAGWNEGSDQNLAIRIGHGVVPIKIENVIQSVEDEIKFVINGISEMYDTYTFNIPVPIHNEKYPFVAKATLCYFPKCSINQGVDYTNTELDMYVGRVNEKGIVSINKNSQSVSDGEKHYIYEGEARKWYRKWDNTKHIKESFGSRLVARRVYESEMWGISLKTKERLNARDGAGIKFGLVVTLKEINGVNRINDFIRQCELRGWLVNKVNVENRIEIYNKAQEDVIFDV